jgi:hypothetical protein
MIAPTSTSPCIKNVPKAATTLPAAAAPSLPWVRINRVVATFSANRKIVSRSSNVGRLENSRAVLRDSETSRMRIDAVNDKARAKSSRNVGIGTIKIESRRITQMPTPTSPIGICRLKRVSPSKVVPKAEPKEPIMIPNEVSARAA